MGVRSLHTWDLSVCSVIRAPTSETRQPELRRNPDAVWFAYLEVELLSSF